MQFDGVQNLQVLQTDPGTGKPVTTVVGAGSTVEAHLTLTLDAAEYDRLASLDYIRFDDTQANAIMADRNATQKLPTARQTFASEFRFVPTALTLRVGLLATIN